MRSGETAMAGVRRGGDIRSRASLLWPRQAAWAVFQPSWIPSADDPLVEGLKRLRVIAGMIVASGVYTFVARDFDGKKVLEHLVVACLVLLVIAPLTVGVMLAVWRRRGPLRPLVPALIGSLQLLLYFVGSAVLAFLLLPAGFQSLFFAPLILWLLWFVCAAAVRVNSNFFGTAAVHRALPPVLASVTSWLMAIPDLVTGDLHGLGLVLGVVFILGTPVLVTCIALYEMQRLRRFHGIRLRDHPGTLRAPEPAPLPQRR
ncbi:hypothetical protein AB0D04_26375 [Streptomyces sp. NPDC048483]|uniref:hypothetical protein n=1 Tax=Streptomyces sp. NPDC048483 TaxID=3154927 RepID=UPI003429C647